MDKKGISLVLILAVLVVLVIISLLFISLTGSETQLARNQIYSVRAFYLAEAGVQNAIYRLQKNNQAGFQGALYGTGAGIVEYLVNITGPAPTYRIHSSGYYPNSTSVDKVTRKVQVDVTITPYGNPGLVTNAITLNGTLQTSGAVEINGNVAENATFNFQATFGMTKEALKERADHQYTDPNNNILPVNNVTWIDLVNDDTFVISDTNWSGTGILIINGGASPSGTTLEITGGLFHGIIWVIGNLRMSGNSNVSGAIFVESGSAEVTKVTGTPVISYNSSDVENALKGLGGFVTNVSNWKEVRE